jgi:Uma2 family endonuclease
MVSMTVVERHAGPWTRAQRDALPNDGRRHELLDGVLVVTPAPAARHQLVVSWLMEALMAARPDELRVLSSPVDVVTADDSVFQPDLVVVRAGDIQGHDIEVPPLLAVEVLSPGNRGYDLIDKREHYQRAGIASYWVIDPEVAELIAWELRDGAYVEVARARDDQPFEAERPYPVTVVPSKITKL